MFFDFTKVFLILETCCVVSSSKNLVWIIGLDVFSLIFIILTTFLMSIVVLST